MPTNSVGVASAAAAANPCEGNAEKKGINPELWQACAGPLVNLPPAGTHVVYFPQGHSEQVAASLKKDADTQIPNYPNLPSKLLCLLHNVTLHADPETDEVYAQMTLQPVPSYDKDALLRSDYALKSNKPQPEFFCKTLTASDTSTHGGFSVPRRAAEKIFPPLDFSMQPPAQELVARDLHDTLWTFRHIYRGQPKRHLLTTGWSLFVSGKRLLAGDSVLFIRDEKQQLLLGIRRANRQPTNLSSSVLSSDSMHIGILAAAAHAFANNSPFNVFYNPRASPSEFVIPLAKYYKAVYGCQMSPGMRFRMIFETEDSGTRRYMGTVTGISDLDPARWKNSHWRNLQVGWDESTGGERRNRVSLWEIEPVTAPFFICPPPFFRSKRPRQPGMPDEESHDLDNLFKRAMPWLGEDMGIKDSQGLPALSLVQWMNTQQNPSTVNSIQPNYAQSFPGSILQNLGGPDLSRQLGLSESQIHQSNNLQFTAQRMSQQVPQQQQKNLGDQNIPSSRIPTQNLQAQADCIIQQQPSIQNHQLHRTLPQNLQQQITGQSELQNTIQSHLPDQLNQQLPMSDRQIQLQLMQKLQQQTQSLLGHQSLLQQPNQNQLTQLQDQHRQILEMPQAMPSLPPIQSNTLTQQMTKTNFSHPTQQPKLQQQQQQAHLLSDLSGLPKISPTPTTNQHLTACSSIITGPAGGAGQSGITDDFPSCSTSPSTNNYSDVNGRVQRMGVAEEMAQSTATILCSSNANLARDLQQKPEVRPPLNLPKSQDQAIFTQQTFLNGPSHHTDFLDSSSSTTSVCLPQNNAHLNQNNNNWMSFNQQPMMMFRNTVQELEVQPVERNNVPFEPDIDGQMGLPLDYPNIFSSGGMPTTTCENPRDSQQELSSSLVSQSFGVPDMTFNSVDSTINDSSFLNRGTWVPPPQIQRMRTYTKVYKRGAVGRSIDITRYSGYEELKQDLARRFGIEGQLEDGHGQKIGWKLVYVDHENDVLLVGDDPWEEFVNCVRCIKILSRQEVQQMSLDGDFGNGVLPNQACSSSDCKNA